jgi:hypothetical protein
MSKQTHVVYEAPHGGAPVTWPGLMPGVFPPNEPVALEAVGLDAKAVRALIAEHQLPMRLVEAPADPPAVDEGSKMKGAPQGREAPASDDKAA